MTLAGTLELVARGRELRTAGGGLQLPQSDSSLRGRSLSATTPAPRASPGCCSPTCRRAGIRASSAPSSASPLDLIRLIAPTTRDRATGRRGDGAEGFVYLVARLGVTGASRSLADDLAESVARVRGATRAPGGRRVRDLHRRRRPPSVARTGRRRRGRAARWWTPSAATASAGRAPLPARAPGRAGRRSGGAWHEHGRRHGCSSATPGCCAWAARLLTGRGAAGGPAVAGQQPVATLILTGGIVLILRASPVRLSKYSYLTQSGVAVLVGAVTVGPSPVVAALYLGVLLSDVVLAPQAASGRVHQRGPRGDRLHRRLRALCRGSRPHRLPGPLARAPSRGGGPRLPVLLLRPGCSSTSPCWCGTSWSTPKRS